MEAVLERPKKVLRTAETLFDRSKDWVEFFCGVLGPGGIVRKLYPDSAALAEFQKTPEHAAIQQMLAMLRDPKGPKAGCTDPIKVITVRLPESMHEALADEAYLHHTSVNQLCISKLLQLIDEDHVPSQNNNGSKRVEAEK